MYRIIQSIFVLVLLYAVQDVKAQAYTSSAGLKVGSMIAGSYRYNFENSFAVEGIVGLQNKAQRSSFIIGGFYQWNRDLASILDVDGYGFYVGAGSFVSISDGTTSVIPSGIFGLEYTLLELPVNFFLDLSAGYPITQKNADVELYATIGARYLIQR